METAKLKFHEVNELSRTYYFSEDVSYTVCDVRRIAIRPTNHRLETADGRKFIIPSTYIAIEIMSNDWEL